MAKKQINILSLQTTSEIGGADLALFRTLTRINSNYFKASVVLPKDGPLVALYREANIPVYFVPYKKISRRLGFGYQARFLLEFLLRCSQVDDICRENNIDILHANTLHCPYGWLPAWNLKIPLVWHVREILTHSSFIGTVEKRFASVFARKILAVSQAVMDVTLPGHKKVDLQYDGVDTSIFSPDGNDLRFEFGIKTDEFLVGIAARIDPWKGVVNFIEAIKLARDKQLKIKGIIAGGPIEGHEDYHKKCLELIEKYGLQVEIKICGWNYTGNDMAQIYRSMDVIINASTSPEPFGLSLVEAQACGVPAISGRAGGPAEIIEEGVTGLLVDVPSSEALAEKILILFEKNLLSTDCVKRIRKRFDAQDCVNQFEEKLKNIIL